MSIGLILVGLFCYVLGQRTQVHTTAGAVKEDLLKVKRGTEGVHLLV